MLHNLKGERAVWWIARIVCLSAVCLSAGAAEGGSVSLETSVSDSPSPPVSRSFSEAISTRPMVVEDFDRFAANQSLESVALSNFILVVDDPSVTLIAASERMLGRALPSNPFAAHVVSGGAIPQLEWRFDVPVASWDFVFIDLDGGGFFEVTYADGSAPSALSLLASPSSYQWVGLLSDQSDMATVRFVPNQPRSYGFDNVRTTLVPEPGVVTLFFLVIGPGLALYRRRDHRQHWKSR